MPNIYLGTPSTRPFSPQYVSALWQTRIQGNAAWAPVMGQDIQTGRNQVVKNFLDNRVFDFLLMHDSDCTWHPDAVMRLAERNLPVVSGIIFKRGLPTVPTLGKYVGPNVEGRHMYSFGGTVNTILDRAEIERVGEEAPHALLFPKREQDLVEIDGAGAHFMLIRRDVLVKIGPPWYECTTTNGGEDFDFCRKVQKAGFPLHADFSVFTGHVVGDGMEIGLREFLLFRDKDRVDVPWVV